MPTLTIKTNVAVAKLRKTHGQTFIVYNVDDQHLGYVSQHDDGNWLHSRSFQSFTNQRAALENLQRAVV